MVRPGRNADKRTSRWHAISYAPYTVHLPIRLASDNMMALTTSLDIAAEPVLHPDIADDALMR
jgi:hypothetical protein